MSYLPRLFIARIRKYLWSARPVRIILIAIIFMAVLCPLSVTALLPHTMWWGWVFHFCTLLAMVIALYEIGARLIQHQLLEIELKINTEHLDKLVESRTDELQDAVQRLQQEIYERRQTEQALSDSRQHLESTLKAFKETQAKMIQSEKMASIGHLAAGVAHEINNPIGFIKSNLGAIDDYRNDLGQLIEDFKHFFEEVKKSELGKNGALGQMITHLDECMDQMDLAYIQEDFPQVIAESQNGVERVAQIVSDLKKFSHTGEDQMSCSNINEGIESTLNVAWNELKYKAKVTKRLGSLPLVKCNIQKINQVVMNLLVNAAQAIEGRGEIFIETRHDGDWVEIAVSDTGCGIENEHLSQIFDPFFTTKPVGTGSGLGLNVSYNIIQSHAGSIQVESLVGKGTTFTVQLPVAGNQAAAYGADAV